ncbi:MAG: hypothetical protein RL254_804 [Planctomycetota bacterium]|jgi:hypothetical protein
MLNETEVRALIEGRRNDAARAMLRKHRSKDDGQ